VFLFPGALFFLGALVSFLPLWDIDWPLHVALGRTILSRGALPFQDTLSWTAWGRADVPHEWLFQVLWALLDRAGGPALLKGAVSLLTGAGTALWFRAARKAGRPAWPACTLSLAALVLFYPRLRARPDLVTWIALPSVLPFLLPGERPSWKRALGLFLLVGAWANFHGAALLAPLWFWAGWAGRLLEGLLDKEKREGHLFPALPLAATAGVLATPSGPALLSYAWRTKDFGPIVPEWTSLLGLPPTQLFLALKIAMAALALALLGALVLEAAGKRIFQGEGSFWAAGAAGTLLALRAYRFSTAAAPGLLFFLPRKTGGRTRSLFPALSLALALLLVSFWAGRTSLRLFRPGRYPVEAADFLEGRKLPEGTRLFHEPGWGGYLAYRLHPPCLVAVDGRVTLFGPELCRAVLEMCRGRIPPGEVKAWLDRGKVDLVIMPEDWGENFLDPLDWRRIFQGPSASVWERR